MRTLSIAAMVCCLFAWSAAGFQFTCRQPSAAQVQVILASDATKAPKVVAAFPVSRSSMFVESDFSHASAPGGDGSTCFFFATKAHPGAAVVWTASSMRSSQHVPLGTVRVASRNLATGKFTGLSRSVTPSRNATGIKFHATLPKYPSVADFTAAQQVYLDTVVSIITRALPHPYDCTAAITNMFGAPDGVRVATVFFCYRNSPAETEADRFSLEEIITLEGKARTLLQRRTINKIGDIRIVGCYSPRELVEMNHKVLTLMTNFFGLPGVRTIVPESMDFHYDVIGAPNDVYSEWAIPPGLGLSLGRNPLEGWTSKQRAKLYSQTKKMFTPIKKDRYGCPRMTIAHTLDDLKAQIDVQSRRRSLQQASVPPTMASPPPPTTPPPKASPPPRSPPPPTPPPPRVSGAWGPIYSMCQQIPCQTQNNTGLVGVGYNIIKAAPDARTSPDGVDRGIVSGVIFTTNLNFQLTPVNSAQTSSVSSATYSSDSLQQSTAKKIGVSGGYYNATASSSFDNSKAQSSSQANKGATTVFYATVYNRRSQLNSYAQRTSSDIFTPTFFAEATGLMDGLIETNYQVVDNVLGNSQTLMNLFISRFGTSFITSSFDGGVISQACFMTASSYGFASNQSQSFEVSAAYGVEGIKRVTNTSASGSYGSSSSSASSQDFSSLDISCQTVQTPSVAMQVANPDNGITTNDLSTWQRDMNAVQAASAIEYTVTPITDLFKFPAIWDNRYTRQQLFSIMNAMDNYIGSCMGDPSLCSVFSPTCTPQTINVNGNCKSCFTAGSPGCALKQPNSVKTCTINPDSCTCQSPPATTYYPWDPTCSGINYGTCTATLNRKGINSCDNGENRCAPGYKPVVRQDQKLKKTRCACRCEPSSAVQGAPGGPSGGCGTLPGIYCGPYSGKYNYPQCVDITCTNTQSSIYPVHPWDATTF